MALRYCASTLHKARSRLGAHSSKLWTYTGNWAGSGCFFARCVTLPARTWWGVVLCPALTLSRGKGSGDYWVLPWLCQISNFDIWTKEWLYFYDVALFHWLVPTLVWCCAISLACSESILLTRYNQESSQWSPDAFPHERVGSGHETRWRAKHSLYHPLWSQFPDFRLHDNWKLYASSYVASLKLWVGHLGWAWVSPTLAWLHCTHLCVCLLAAVYRKF